MEYIYDDGGRSVYFEADKVGDCVTRAVAIATKRDYKDVYESIKDIVGYSPRNGVHAKDTRKVMQAFGATWHPMMTIGSGCKVHLKDNEVPMHGVIVCKVTKHVCAIIDGVIHDTYDASRDGTRCVYGYWTFDRNSSGNV